VATAPQPPSDPSIGPPSWPTPPDPAPASAPQGAIHPLSFGRALNVGWSLYRYRWRAMLGVAAVFMGPAYLVAAMLNVAYGESFLRWQRDLLPRFGQQPPQLAELVPWDALALALLSSVLLGLGAALAAAAIVHLVGWTYGGGRPSAAQVIARTVARVPSLLGGMLIATLVLMSALIGGAALVAIVVAVGGGGLTIFLALLVAVSMVAVAILLTARWALLSQAIMLDGRGAVGALGRSWRLVLGSTWRVIGYIVGLALIGLPFSLAAGAVATVLFGTGIDWRTLEPVWDPLASAAQVVAAGVAVWLVQPFAAAVMTLLYYDLRLKQGERLAPPAG